MKLATLRNGARDGRLVVVSRDLTRYTDASFLVPTLQRALDDWRRIAPHLEALAESLEHGAVPSERFHEHDALSPLPRAYLFLRGTVSVVHGNAAAFLAPREPIPAILAEFGAAFELQGAVILDDVPAGATVEAAREAIRLVMLASDLTLQGTDSPPYAAFSPVAVTPDELGAGWEAGRLHLPLQAELNGKPVGSAGSRMIDFPALIADAARLRPLGAGTIIGAGAAAREVAGTLKPGDRIRIELRDKGRRSVFGAIEQTVG